MSAALSPAGVPFPVLTASRRAAIRLLVIPLLIYGLWLAEIWLLAGSRSLFVAPEFIPLVVYTLAGVVLIGIIVPVMIICRSFCSGAVTMHQAGFRSPGRIIAVLPVILVPVVLFIWFLIPAPGRAAFFSSFLLYLPTGIAAVMVCWALVGTHLQALVRAGGVLVSITTGIVVTAILFSLSMAVLAPVPVGGQISGVLFLGIITAFTFFASRDIYGTMLVATTGMAFLFPPAMATGSVPPPVPAPLVALAALAALLLVHGYLSRTYSTVLVVRDP